MGYNEWARNLVKTRPRLAGAYLMLLGASCFGVLFVAGRVAGLWYFAFVPAFCVLFGAWMLLFGPVARGARTPAWYRHGILAVFVISLGLTITAPVWGPRALDVIAR